MNLDLARKNAQHKTHGFNVGIGGVTSGPGSSQQYGGNAGLKAAEDDLQKIRMQRAGKAPGAKGPKFPSSPTTGASGQPLDENGMAKGAVAKYGYAGLGTAEPMTGSKTGLKMRKRIHHRDDGTPVLAAGPESSNVRGGLSTAQNAELEHRRNITRARPLSIEGFRGMSPTELEAAMDNKLNSNAMAYAQKKADAKEAKGERREQLLAARQAERVASAAPDLFASLLGPDGRRKQPQANANSLLTPELYAMFTGQTPSQPEPQAPVFTKATQLDAEGNVVQPQMDAMLDALDSAMTAHPGSPEEQRAYLQREYGLTDAQLRDVAWDQSNQDNDLFDFWQRYWNGDRSTIEGRVDSLNNILGLPGSAASPVAPPAAPLNSTTGSPAPPAFPTAMTAPRPPMSDFDRAMAAAFLRQGPIPSGPRGRSTTPAQSRDWTGWNV